MRDWKGIAPVFAVLVVAGCAGLPTSLTPQTPRQAVAAAELTFTGIVQQLHQECDVLHTIDEQVCLRARETARDGDLILDGLQASVRQNPAGGVDLAAINAAIRELRLALAEKE